MKAAKRRLSIFAKPRLRRAESRFQNIGSFLKKVLIVAVRSCGCGVLNRGLQNLGSSRKGDGFILFALCKKNQKAHQRFANLWTPGTIQSSVESEFAEISGGTSRTRFFAQDGGEKALNRCDAPTLQRKDLERTTKEWPCSFVDSRLWLSANLRRLWWKRVALGGDKERFVQKKNFCA